MGNLIKKVLTGVTILGITFSSISCNEDLARVGVGAGVGAGTGALIDGSKGAKTGAVSGALSVVIADAVVPKKESPSNQGQYQSGQQQLPTHYHGDYGHSHQNSGPHDH